MLSPAQVMNTSFEPLHLVNTYGAFGSITRERLEIVIEGTDEREITETTRWREYEFKGKPGDPRRMPTQFAPYHLRLDWLMWFAAMSQPSDYEWFAPLLVKLLHGDPRHARSATVQSISGSPAAIHPRAALPVSSHPAG